MRILCNDRKEFANTQEYFFRKGYTWIVSGSINMKMPDFIDKYGIIIGADILDKTVWWTFINNVKKNYDTTYEKFFEDIVLDRTRNYVENLFEGIDDI